MHLEQTLLLPARDRVTYYFEIIAPGFHITAFTNALQVLFSLQLPFLSASVGLLGGGGGGDKLALETLNVP